MLPQGLLGDSAFEGNSCTEARRQGQGAGVRVDSRARWQLDLLARDFMLSRATSQRGQSGPGAASYPPPNPQRHLRWRKDRLKGTSRARGGQVVSFEARDEKGDTTGRTQSGRST